MTTFIGMMTITILAIVAGMALGYAIGITDRQD
jgi:hypothetical protein